LVFSPHGPYILGLIRVHEKRSYNFVIENIDGHCQIYFVFKMTVQGLDMHRRFLGNLFQCHIFIFSLRESDVKQFVSTRAGRLKVEGAPRPAASISGPTWRYIRSGG